MNLLTSFTDEKVPTADDSHKDSEIEFLDDDENNDWIGNSDVVGASGRCRYKLQTHVASKVICEWSLQCATNHNV
jgi:hypothetical protein